MPLPLPSSLYFFTASGFPMSPAKIIFNSAAVFHCDSIDRSTEVKAQATAPLSPLSLLIQVSQEATAFALPVKLRQMLTKKTGEKVTHTNLPEINLVWFSAQSMPSALPCFSVFFFCCSN